MTARLTAGSLNRATLDRQLLLRREPLPVVEAVHRVVALQGQEPPSPYLALWNRIEGFDPADLDRAFRNHDVVKATLMRVTQHVVDARDYPTFHEAMQPTLRAARLNDRRFRRIGMTPDDADALLPTVLDYASTPRSNQEAEAWLDERLGDLPKPSLWWAYRQYGPFIHHPTGGPWSFGTRPAYVAAREVRLPGDQAASLARLVRRYLEGFGPATIADFAGFALLQRPLVRAAFAANADLEQREGPGNATFFDLPGGKVPDEDSPAPPRLLPMWDSTLLAYAERSRIIPEAFRKQVIRSNGDTLPTLLVDGHVAGVWRPIEDGGIEATAFQRLDDDTWDALESEGHGLTAFLAARDPAIYRRYNRWWAELAAAEVRVLGR